MGLQKHMTLKRTKLFKQLNKIKYMNPYIVSSLGKSVIMKQSL